MTNWSQFVAAFGEFTEGAYLAHAVYGYFANGGGAGYVVRVGGAGTPPARRGDRRPPRRGRPAPPAGARHASRWRPWPGRRAGALTVEVADAEGEDPPRTGSGWSSGRRQGPSRRSRSPPRRATARPTSSPGHGALQADRGARRRRRPRSWPGRRTRPWPCAAGPRARRRRAAGAPAARPDEYVGDAADRTGFGGLEADRRDHHGRRARPDGRLPARRDRPGGRQGRAARR